MKYLVLALAGLLAINGCHAADAVKLADFYGTWKVTKIVTVGDVSESEAQMNALIGTQVTISAKEVIEDGERCSLARGDVKAILVDTYADPELRLSHIEPRWLGLPAHAPKLDGACITFYKAGDYLIFGDRGAFYSAERVTIISSI